LQVCTAFFPEARFLGVDTAFNGSYVLGRWSQLQITLESNMKNDNLRSMSVDELWKLHEMVATELSRRILAEQAMLEKRLRQLSGNIGDGGSKRARRPYPKVLPKYRNPKNRRETWAGRGKQPRWLIAHLRDGKQLEDFRIRA
jgi:DNA-binding protein H-NS